MSNLPFVQRAADVRLTRLITFGLWTVGLWTFQTHGQNIVIQPDPEAQVIIRSNEWSTFGTASEFTPPSAEQLKDVQIDPALQLLVNQLEHPTFAVREEATRLLIESMPDRLQLYALLSRPEELSAEQRYRVLTAMRESLLRTPRGAIGISMQPIHQFDLGTIEIRVTEVIPGLPAEHVLKIGDRITQVDDHVLTMHDDLQFRVQCKRPGDTVRLTVKRAKVGDDAPPAVAGLADDELFDVLHIDLQLGSTEALREFNEVQANMLNRIDPALVQPLSRVERSRLAEARLAGETLSPRPRALPINGGSGLTELPTSMTRALEMDVEQHPAVRELVFQLQRLERQPATADEMQALNERWQEQLQTLYVQSQHPDITRDKQDYMTRVIRRYLELLQQ